MTGTNRSEPYHVVVIDRRTQKTYRTAVDGVSFGDAVAKASMACHAEFYDIALVARATILDDHQGLISSHPLLEK